jgi:hypothetical protein
MKTLKFPLAMSISCVLAACGGSGSSGSGSSAATNYNFVIPAVNTQLTYDETLVDNSDNTINLSYTQTVVAKNANGTFVVFQNDPANNSVTVDGTNYSVVPETITLTSSGQILSTVNQNTQITCTNVPFGEGPVYPISVGKNWSTNFAVTCGSGPSISYYHFGNVVDLETVTVPAGTFSALKLASGIDFTDANGTTHSVTTTTWRDAATGIIVQQQAIYGYGGTPQTSGYVVSSGLELASGTP